MASKRVWIEDIGEVLLSKRRGASGLRLSINSIGKVRISLPHWLPYKTAEVFALKRKDWILKHQGQNQPQPLLSGAKIGKTYRLLIAQTNQHPTLRSRITGSTILISTSYPATSDLVQQRAIKASERALAKEAGIHLPAKLESLAKLHGFKYKEVRIRKLTSRWGSCSHKKTITLSFYLMQLPWELIEYVMIHELVHTKHLNHSPKFWKTMNQLIPDLQTKRRLIRQHKPRLEPS